MHTPADPGRRRPVVLCVLDGWGHREDPRDNAIAVARTLVYDRLMRTGPRCLLAASAEDVGLPERQMGNSEVGHMNLGAGRTVHQALRQIDDAAELDFAGNEPLQQVLRAMRGGGTLHLMGLLSPGGVHSHMRHLPPLARAAANSGVPVAMHVFADGRDAPPKSALEYLAWFEGETAGTEAIRIATVCGRYFTMDRDRRWERVERGYRALTEGEGAAAPTARAAVEAGYARGETDEFLQPTVVAGYGGMCGRGRRA